MHLFHYPKVDFLARDGQCLLIQSDEHLAERVWVEGWVVGQLIHIRIQVVEHIDRELWAPNWWHELGRLRERLGRAACQHIYRVSIRRPVEFIPLLDTLLEPAPAMDGPPAGPRRQTQAESLTRLAELGREGLGLSLLRSWKRGDLLHFRVECDGDPNRCFELIAQMQSCAPGDGEPAQITPRYGKTSRQHRVDGRAAESLRLTLMALTRVEKTS